MELWHQLQLGDGIEQGLSNVASVGGGTTGPEPPASTAAADVADDDTVQPPAKGHKSGQATSMAHTDAKHVRKVLEKLGNERRMSDVTGCSSILMPL